MKAGWTTKRLGEVCTTFADGDWIESRHQSPSGVRLIQTGNIGEGIFKDRAEKARFISKATFAALRCTEVFEGDCLLSRLPDPVGRSCLLPATAGRMITAVDCTILRFDAEQIVPDFFVHYSQSEGYLEAVRKACTGTTRNRISRSNLGLVEIPLPPLPEQRRIVALLYEAFAGLATAAANAERNLDNARELFESHLAEVFSWRGDGWVETTLGEIADFKNGLNYTRSSRGQTIPFVGVGDFKSNLVVPVAELESVTIDGVLPPDYALETGDILMVRSNGSRDLVGRSMLVPPMKGPTSFSGFLIRVRGKRSAVDPEFLVYLLRCRDTKEQLKRGGGGASISNINQKVLAGLRLRLPPKMAQRRVVKLLDALSLETDRLSRLYEQKQAALAELKKSLLHQAFSGAL